MVFSWGSSLILIVSSSFPVVSIGSFEVRDDLVQGLLLITVEVVISLKINIALVWQLKRLRFWRSILEKAEMLAKTKPP
jgi:hypothetical protein